MLNIWFDRANFELMNHAYYVFVHSFSKWFTHSVLILGRKKCHNPKGHPLFSFIDFQPLMLLFIISTYTCLDLHNGHLGEILALIFALSHYKQQQKALNLVSASPQHIPKFQASPKISHASVGQVRPTQIPGQQKTSSIVRMSSATTK
jgi:hypothetical protein